MIFTYLLALIPISLLLEFLHAPPLWVFFTSALAIIPLAEWMRRGTEQIAARAGSAIGGLLSVTFGNAAELILAIFVLSTGNTHVVKATITGSIVGNSLLGLGLAIVAGSWGRVKQTFPRERAGLLASLLIISVIALLLPALFDYTERGILRSPNAGPLDQNLSLGVAIVLILVSANSTGTVAGYSLLAVGLMNSIMFPTIFSLACEKLGPRAADGSGIQDTEQSVGPFELHDFFLFHFLRYGAPPEKILFLAEQARFDRAYSPTELRQWLKIFIRRFFASQFKRSCLPDGPKVGSVCLSPRGDWRMPSDAEATLWLQWAESAVESGA